VRRADRTPPPYPPDGEGDAAGDGVDEGAAIAATALTARAWSFVTTTNVLSPWTNT
jgi:hypothetical protein